MIIKVWCIFRGPLAFIGFVYLTAAITCTSNGGGVLFSDNSEAFEKARTELHNVSGFNAEIRGMFPK